MARQGDVTGRLGLAEKVWHSYQRGPGDRTVIVRRLQSGSRTARVADL